MSKLLAVVITVAFAGAVGAQTTAPKPTSKERQQDVRSTTDAAAASNTGAQTAAEQAARTKASREVAKMTTAEKKAYAAEINKSMVNPDNPSGSVAGTSAQQKANTAESKGTTKQKTNLNTPEAQKSMQKAATP